MGTGQLILFWLYVLAGPLAWLTLLGLMLLGRSRMARLRQKHYELPDPPPPVTVIIPAKDEGAGIRACIQRVLAMDYPIFDVIAVNDRSGDDTGAIVEELARSSAGKLQAIHIRPNELPDGWLGKCNALHIGSRAARGKWILFVDSDVKVEAPALRAVLGLAVQRKYDALSILTRLECNSFLERLMLPLAAGAWSVMYTISLTNDDNQRDVALANGQFFLIRRDVYESVHGHEAVRDQIVEDVELSRLLKASGHRVRFQLGKHLASTRMHSNLRQMFNGWGRIYSGTSRRRPGRIVGAILFLLVCGLSAYPALAWGAWLAVNRAPWWWLLAGGAHLAVMTMFLAIIYRGSGNRARHAALFPISAGLLMAIMGYALRLCRTGRVSWRGSDFQAGAPPVASSPKRSN